MGAVQAPVAAEAGTRNVRTMQNNRAFVLILIMHPVQQMQSLLMSWRCKKFVQLIARPVRSLRRRRSSIAGPLRWRRGRRQRRHGSTAIQRESEQTIIRAAASQDRQVLLSIQHVRDPAHRTFAEEWLFPKLLAGGCVEGRISHEY